MAKSKLFDLEALDRESCGLRLRFDSAGDGYLQSIDAVANGAASPLLLATPSPPFQEIVRSMHDDSSSLFGLGRVKWPALLLTGAGHQAYWSASAIAVTDVRLALLSFDFACRSGTAAVPPAVTFSTADGVHAEQSKGDDDDAISLRSINGRNYWLWAAYRPVSDDPEIENQPTCRLSLSQSQITVNPIGAPHFMNGPSVRWSFEVSLKRDA